MKHLGIEHPRPRVCCKFGSVLYLLGSHWFSPFEDIDVQRKFYLPRWRICSEKSGDAWKNIDGELPVGWIKQKFMTERASVNWWHPPKVQIGGALQSTFQQLHYLFDSDHGLNMFEQDFWGAVQSYKFPCESSYGVSMFLGMWLKSSLHLSRVCHSHQTCWNRYKASKNEKCLKLKVIHHASKAPVYLVEFSFSPMYVQMSRNYSFSRRHCLPVEMDAVEWSDAVESKWPMASSSSSSVCSTAFLHSWGMQKWRKVCERTSYTTIISSTTRECQLVFRYLFVSPSFKLHRWFPGSRPTWVQRLLISERFRLLISKAEVGHFSQFILQPVVKHDAVRQILNIPNSSCQIQSGEQKFWPENGSGPFMSGLPKLLHRWLPGVGGLFASSSWTGTGSLLISEHLHVLISTREVRRFSQSMLQRKAGCSACIRCSRSSSPSARFRAESSHGTVRLGGGTWCWIVCVMTMKDLEVQSRASKTLGFLQARSSPLSSWFSFFGRYRDARICFLQLRAAE